MSRITLPDILAKTGLSTDKTRVSAASAAAQAVLPQMIVLTPVATLHEVESILEHADEAENKSTADSLPFKRRVSNMFRRHTMGAAAIIVLLIFTPLVVAGGAYWSARIKPTAVSSAALKHNVPAHGPNISMPADQLVPTLQQITTQPITLVVGTKTVPVDTATIQSWLHVVTDKKTHTSYIHLNEKAIGPSIASLTGKYAKDPVNQVTVTHPDGSSLVIAGGRDGVNVGDPNQLANQLAPTVLAGKGMQLNVPMQTVPFQAVTAATFDKLIEVNVNSKQMYLYDKGQFTRQYAVSAGAAATPTPIGQFKVYAKYAVQDMKGNNPDGSKYFQPHVRWINYFLPGGYAVHGNYWRPDSVFGAVNTSHGCVSLPEDQAKWVYDWAPIGTTVIVHG
jgi:lipoprotein-anchoring transpeptidase ErfK/SrfK